MAGEAHAYRVRVGDCRSSTWSSTTVWSSTWSGSAIVGTSAGAELVARRRPVQRGSPLWPAGSGWPGPRTAASAGTGRAFIGGCIRDRVRTGCHASCAVRSGPADRRPGVGARRCRVIKSDLPGSVEAVSMTRTVRRPLPGTRSLVWRQPVTLRPSGRAADLSSQHLDLAENRKGRLVRVEGVPVLGPAVPAPPFERGTEGSRHEVRVFCASCPISSAWTSDKFRCEIPGG